MITSSRLKELLDYDDKTGLFTFKCTHGLKYVKKEGDQAGRIHSSGYILIHLDRITYRAHRLAWLYMYDECPKNDRSHRYY